MPREFLIILVYKQHLLHIHTFLEEAATCSQDEAVGGGRETEEEFWVLAGRPDLRARRVTAGPTGLCGV